MDFNMIFLHDSQNAWIAGTIQRFSRGNESRQLHFEHFILIGELSSDCDISFSFIRNIDSAAYIRHAEHCSDFRSDLGRVAVQGLLSAENQVKAAQFADGCCQSIARSQRISAAKCAVCCQIYVISTHGNCILEYLFSLRRSHRQNRYCAANLIAKSESRFQCMKVQRVDNAVCIIPVQTTRIRVNFHFGGVHNLFYANQKPHNSPL